MSYNCITEGALHMPNRLSLLKEFGLSGQVTCLDPVGTAQFAFVKNILIFLLQLLSCPSIPVTCKNILLYEEKWCA